ncbi:MAG: hypothetical protein U5L07_05015 [Desulfobacterales bacterium]|nr:hypothetical protein [Desulfobacterales bacterium]
MDKRERIHRSTDHAFYSDFSKRHKIIDRNSYRVHLFGEKEYFGFFTLRNTSPFNLGRGYIAPDAFAEQKGHLLLQQMPKFIWVAEYIAKPEYPDHVHSRFIFDATAMEYAGIDMMISARTGNLFICEGNSVELDNIRDPIYRHNLAEAYHGMGEENDGSQ